MADRGGFAAQSEREAASWADFNSISICDSISCGRQKFK